MKEATIASGPFPVPCLAPICRCTFVINAVQVRFGPLTNSSGNSALAALLKLGSGQEWLLGHGLGFGMVMSNGPCGV